MTVVHTEGDSEDWTVLSFSPCALRNPVSCLVLTLAGTTVIHALDAIGAMRRCSQRLALARPPYAVWDFEPSKLKT